MEPSAPQVVPAPLKITLNQPNYTTGQTLSGVVYVTSTEPINADKLQL